MAGGKQESRESIPVDVLFPVSVGGICLIVYMLTMASELTWLHWGSDGGDLVSAAYLGRLAHPPGAPLYWLLGRLFIRIPLGNPALRMNLLSALSAATAITVFASAMISYGYDRLTVATCGFCVAFSPLFWSQALITEVYSLAAVFVALLMFVHAQSVRSKQSNAFLMGVLTGLAGSVHLTTLALFIAFFPGQKLARIRYMGGLLGGLCLYTVFFLVRPCTQIWGDMCTLAGWWNYISARMYAGYSFGLSIHDVPSRLLALLSTLSRQFTPIGALLILVGIGEHLFAPREGVSEAIGPNPSLTLRYMLSFACVSIYALFYDTADSLVYLVPVVFIMGYLLALGLKHLNTTRIPRWGPVLIPLFILVVNWSNVSLAGDTAVVDWRNRALSQLPVDALAVTQRARYTFDLWYSVEVAGYRHDILVIDESLWHYAPYRSYMQTRYERVPQGDDLNETTRPVCMVSEEVICK